MESSRDSGMYTDYLFMIVIIGDSSVGKSCLLKRFAEPKSNLFSEAHVATIGVDFAVRIVDIMGRKIKLQVWDTAG